MLEKLIPLLKIPGGENCSDMMTKHPVAAKLDMSISRMIIVVVQGRSNKAAKLYSVDESVAPEFVRIRGNV